MDPTTHVKPARLTRSLLGRVVGVCPWAAWSCLYLLAGLVCVRVAPALCSPSSPRLSDAAAALLLASDDRNLRWRRTKTGRRAGESSRLRSDET